jgi:tRNA U34 2-thiouridine synthase MnmA/TrmU
MKALALISGGLDSTLAAKLVKEQGIEVIGLNFHTSFGTCEKDAAGQLRNRAEESASSMGIELKTIDISEDFFRMFKNPRYGYGANINPCIDCKILMLRKAKELMEGLDAAFVVTGEVLGQRPMSQHRYALKIIEEESGLKGLVVRPLSARLLGETIPEKEGWVSRDKLLDFSGRSRKPQMALACAHNIKDYPNAAGGCLLTDPEFAKRLKELIGHQELSMQNVKLLKIGRHFRISERTKLVVGRNEKENEQLVSLAGENDYLFLPTEELAGPTSLGRGIFNEALINLSCRITCRYCDLIKPSIPNVTSASSQTIVSKGVNDLHCCISSAELNNGKMSADIIYLRFPKGKEEILNVSAIEENRISGLRI